jgi:hypothetical protein
LLGRYQFKEALTSFLPHHAAPKTPSPAAVTPSRHFTGEILNMVPARWVL